MKQGKRSNVAKAKKGSRTTRSTSVPTVLPRIARYHTVNLSAPTYYLLRKLADHYSLPLGQTVALLVDAGCVGAGIREGKE